MSEDKLQAAMDAISDFYFGESEDSGEQMFKKFANKHKELFDVTEGTDMEEHKLEFTDVYKEFQTLFETKIEELVEKSGASSEEFVEALKARSKTDEEVKMFLEIIVSVADYQNFLEMMVAHASTSHTMGM
ncbi:unnamed protein product [Moneuplotes crassus]|uniref:Cilia- and flagella-associated protein 36 n=1 Tax=Euplotes crassus TaxID=5936 RepID=A0A7S3NWU7_EUPCR|nr:unnamed protein product [Moneuplotes crassus]|mmetsp:Transcript_30151/g.29642  ORF Transcript_30151/g.29642 Transcript_30151/m.29642 type:complete len:131 (+) Transcript_30151:21-413(+)